MNELVDIINGVQDGDKITVNVPIIGDVPITITGNAKVSSDGKITINANEGCSIDTGIPLVNTIDISNISLVINRGEGINYGDNISANISANATKTAFGITTNVLTLDNTSLLIDLSNNTMTVSGAPSLPGVNLNDTFDISGGDDAFSVYNVSEGDRKFAEKNQEELYNSDFAKGKREEVSLETLESMINVTDAYLNEDITFSDGEGFTGFNPAKAKKDIENFYNKAVGAGARMCYTYMHLMHFLSTTWYAPVAAFYGTIIAKNSEKLCSEYKACIDNVYEGAVNAYNKVASVNGMPNCDIDSTMLSQLGDYVSAIGEMTLKSARDDGAIVIDVVQVPLIREAFDAATKLTAEKLNELSGGIALYDDDNAQQEAFKTTIKAIADKFIENNGLFHTALVEAIKEQEEKSKAAAEQAAGIISGS